MENRLRYRLSVALAITGLALLAAPPVSAEEHPPAFEERNAMVYTTRYGAVVEAELKAGGPAGVSSNPGRKRSCHLEPDTANSSSGSAHIYAAHPNERSFNLYCDGRWMGLVWRRIDADPPRRVSAADARGVAMRLREEIPMPGVSVGVNPGGDGLVGVEVWFWIEGYRGEAITHSSDAFGLPVDVEARPSAYRWSFGDGSVVESESLGSAYPERSEIRHVYERSSASHAAGYPIDIEFVFEIRYRMGGGPWVGLPSISRSAHLDYPVRESQAVIVQ